MRKNGGQRFLNFFFEMILTGKSVIGILQKINPVTAIFNRFCFILQLVV